MTIDIIDLSDPQYSDLNPVQLAMVRAAQAKKDALTAQAESEKEELLYITLKNGFAHSSVRAREESAIDAQLEKDIEVIRSDLMYQLAYEALGTEGNEKGPYRYPENPNYNLGYSQRFLVVRSYYMDTLARTYLGEFYQTLYDLLASYC